MKKKQFQKISVIDQKKCIGCGACLQNCPANAIEMKAGWVCYVIEEKCVGCGKCVSLCHRGAPFFVKEP